MKIYIDAKVGALSITINDLETIDEARNAIEWIYEFEAREERQAIVMADKVTLAPVTLAEPEIPFDPEPAKPATAAEAVAIVKEYASKKGVNAAKELMAKLGISRTNEITDDLAAKAIELVRSAA